MTNPGAKTCFVSSPLTILVIAIVYGVAAKASFLFTIPPGNISPIFPAAGIALAAVMIMGRKALIGIWLGSFVANTFSFMDGSMSSASHWLPGLLVAMFIGLGAMSGAAAGAFLVRRFCKDEHPLLSGRNMLILITVGALGCCMVSPTFGVLGLSLAGSVPWQRFGYSWVTWWVGDATGALVAAPLILAWQRRHLFRMSVWSILEAAVLGGTTLLVCFLVFFRNTPFEYGVLTLLLWAAFRFGVRGASTTAAVIALFATIGTSRGSSPFAVATANESLLLLNSFLGVTITCALFLAGIMQERKRADQELRELNRALRESEERLRRLGDNLPDSYIYQYMFKPDGTPQFLYLSAGAERLHGVNVGDVLRNAKVLLGQIAPEQAAAMQAAEAASLRNLTDFTMELRMRRTEGQWRWMQMCSRPRRTSEGQVMWDGVGTDITERKRAEREIEVLARFSTESPSPVLRVGLDGTLLYANPASAALLEAWQCRTGEHLPQEWRAHVAAAVASATRNTVDVTCGQSVYAVLIVPVEGAGYVNLYCRDITENKRAEEEVHTLNANLERRVEERTAELRTAHETLKQRTAELEAFNQAMVNREQRIIEMKEAVNALCRELGREAKYPAVWQKEL